jgi:hypothetical protein
VYPSRDVVIPSRGRSLQGSTLLDHTNKNAWGNAFNRFRPERC